jgi:hypothetical protein
MHDLDRTQLETETPGYAAEQGSAEFESPLSAEQEMELASQLLETSSEQELEQFLGDVLRTAGAAAGRFASSDVGHAIGALLKSAVKQALPAAGQAGQLLGLELEGLSAEDREFEASRQLVRFASSAVQQASQAPPGAEPSAVARQAVATAAHLYAPGLLQRLPGRSSRAWPRSGRWVRQGQTIILYGC